MTLVIGWLSWDCSTAFSSASLCCLPSWLHNEISTICVSKLLSHPLRFNTYQYCGHSLCGSDSISSYLFCREERSFFMVVEAPLDSLFPSEFVIAKNSRKYTPKTFGVVRSSSVWKLDLHHRAPPSFFCPSF